MLRACYPVTLIKVLGCQCGDLGSWFREGSGWVLTRGRACPRAPGMLATCAGGQCVCEAGSTAGRERGPDPGGGQWRPSSATSSSAGRCSKSF